MIAALTAAAAVAAGVPWVTIAAVVAAWTHPLPALVLVTAASLADARRQSETPGLWLAVASELRAGASLRSAIALAAVQHGCPGAARLAAAGADIERVGQELSSFLGIDAAGFRAVVAVSALTGAPSAVAFEQLEATESARASLRREKRVAMAPAMAQAVVVGGIPAVAAVGSALSSGHGSAGGLGRMIAAAGLGLVVTGVGAMAWLTRRALT